MRRVCFLLFFLTFSPLFGGITWSPPQLLFDPVHEGTLYSTSVNINGEAIACKFNARTEEIEISNYDFVESKAQETRLKYPVSCGVSWLKSVLGENKEIFLAWIDLQDNCLKATKYEDEKGWSELLVISNGENIRDPVLYCDASGNGMLLWDQYFDYNSQVNAVYFSAKEEKWSKRETLSPTSSDCRHPRFAFDRQGNAVAIWSARSFFDKKHLDGIEVARFEGDTACWSEALLLSYFDTHFCLTHPALIFDEEDNVYFTWERSEPRTDSRDVQLFSITADLKKQNIVDISEGQTYAPSFVRAADEIFLFWKKESEGEESLQSFRIGGPAHEYLEITPTCQHILGFHLHGDKYGKMDVAYFTEDKLNVTEFEDFWQETCLCEAQVKNMQMEGDEIGNVLVTWVQHNRVYYAQGVYLLPPSHFTVTKFEKKFTAKSVIRALLEWEPIEGASVASYRIRRNGELIGETTSCQFTDTRCPKGTLRYAVTAVNQKRLESKPRQVLVIN